MATWMQILDEDDATIDFNGVEIDIYHVARGWKHMTQFKCSLRGTAKTKVEAKYAALDVLIAKLDEWKAQAQAARDELEVTR